jgi:hypothetical protein
MWHIWVRREMPAGFWWGELKERCSFVELHIFGRYN